MSNDKSDSTVDNFNPTAAPGQQLPDFNKWSEEQVSFAPYWTPAPGKWFYGFLTDVDRRDPKFIRFQFQALANIPCQRGPGDETNDRHEKVLVAAGENFCISVYTGLAGVFDDYTNVNFPVPVRVESRRKVKTKENQDFWEFNVKVAEETKKLLTAYRKDKAMKAGKSSRPALEK